MQVLKTSAEIKVEMILLDRWLTLINNLFLAQKPNQADIRALNPTELANKSLLVLAPEAALCAARGIDVSFALPLAL